jgi:hypothetical protein
MQELLVFGEEQAVYLVVVVAVEVAVGAWSGNKSNLRGSLLVSSPAFGNKIKKKKDCQYEMENWGSRRAPPL